MRQCADTDTLVTIGEAFHWDVAEGLHHLQTCAACRDLFAALEVTRSAFHETAAVDDAELARISARIDVEATRERARAQAAQRWAGLIEAVLAGIAAPIVLISSGIEIGSVAAGLATIAMGVGLLVYGRRLQFDTVRQGVIDS